MNSDVRRAELNQTTERIIAAAFKVSNTLGAGFLEKVYENAMRVELRRQGIEASQQEPIDVYYEGEVVGKYFADILADLAILVEIKALKGIDEVHSAQTMNYLKATGLTLGLILNFGSPKLEIKRVVRDF